MGLTIDKKKVQLKNVKVYSLGEDQSTSCMRKLEKWLSGESGHPTLE